MARLVVVAGASVADGFRLAGASTITARPGVETAVILRGLAADADAGLVLVTADLWESVEERLRVTLERLGRPIVLPIPAGVIGEVTTRRRLLSEMLERAIGYRIELSGAGPR